MTEIVGEAKADCHAGGMTQRPKQEAVAAEPKSATGQYLKPLLERSTTNPVIPAQAGTQPNKDSPDLIRGPASKKRSTPRAHPEPIGSEADRKSTGSLAQAGAQPIKKTRRKAAANADQPDLMTAK